MLPVEDLRVFRRTAATFSAAFGSMRARSFCKERESPFLAASCRLAGESSDELGLLAASIIRPIRSPRVVQERFATNKCIAEVLAFFFMALQSSRQFLEGSPDKRKSRAARTVLRRKVNLFFRAFYVTNFPQ